MTEPAHDTAGVLAPPPVIYGTPLVLGVLLQRVRPTAVMPHGLTRPLGGLLLAGGSALLVWSAVTMRQAHTPIDPREPVARMVTGGPFRRSRNPIYISLTLLYVGITVLGNTLWPLLFLPAVVRVMQRGVIEREERYLERTFGDEYRRYKSRVRRWL